MAFIGVYTLKTTGDLSLKLDNTNPVEYVATSMVVLGSLIFAVSFCGCCGAIRESECLLNLYSLALIFVSIFQLVMAIYTCMYKEEIRSETEKAWNHLWDDRSTSELHAKAIREIQKHVKCCGDTGINSYAITLARSTNNCEFKYYAVGCKRALKDFVTDKSTSLSYISLLMAVIEFMGVIFGCLLSSYYRKMGTR